MFSFWQCGPGGGKVFELCKFVMGTKGLPSRVLKLSNMLENVVGKIGKNLQLGVFVVSFSFFHL